MTCFYCNRVISDDSNFCEFCGKAVVFIPSSVKLPSDVRGLPDDIRQSLSDDRLVAAIYACRDRYGLSQEDAIEFANKVYLQSLLLEGKKLQAVKHYCIANGVGLKEGKDVIDMLENDLKSNPIK